MKMLFWGVFALSLWASAEEVVKTTANKVTKYPAVLAFRGVVFVQAGQDKAPRRAKNHEVLREHALIRTEKGGELDLAFDEFRQVTVLSESEIEIPDISWEGGGVSEVRVKNGEVFWTQVSNQGREVRLKSALFDVNPPVGQFKISYLKDKVSSRVKVFSGTMDFSAMNSENSVLLTDGQTVSFQGVLEDGEVSYDVLLQGKKIPRGHLGSVEKVDPQEISKFSAAEIEKRRKEEQKRLAAKKAKEEILLPGQICRKPGGKLNECVWRCQGNPKSEKKSCQVDAKGVSCIRQRCNANGQWGEETLLPADEGRVKCVIKPLVGPCDY